MSDHETYTCKLFDAEIRKERTDLPYLDTPTIPQPNWLIELIDATGARRLLSVAWVRPRFRVAPNHGVASLVEVELGVIDLGAP